MNTLWTLALLLLLCPLVNAQAIILKNDHTEISATITEITDDEVKFKYFSRPTGPIYSLKKSKIFVIIHSDGTREKFGSPSEAPVPAPVTSSLNKSASTPGPSTTRAEAPTVAQPTSSEADAKRTGWTGSLGYTTPLYGFAEAHAINYGVGYFFLGKGRRGGILLDAEALDFFGEGTPNYGLLAASALFRPSEKSKFYLGAGAGYGLVSVRVATYDRYNVKTTKSVFDGDFGGKAFMGWGLFRVALVVPSFQSIEGSGLLSVGLATNPW